MIESGRNPKNTVISTGDKHFHDYFLHVKDECEEINEQDFFLKLKRGDIKLPLDVSPQSKRTESVEFIPEILQGHGNKCDKRTKDTLRLPHWLEEFSLTLDCTADVFVLSASRESLRDFSNLRIMFFKPIELTIFSNGTVIQKMPNIVFCGKTQYIEIMRTIPEDFENFLKKYLGNDIKFYIDFSLKSDEKEKVQKRIDKIFEIPNVIKGKTLIL